MIKVFTNGCFDLLHAGHVRLLTWAKSQGDQLIVGLNSDRSVRQLKGPGRPIIPVMDRLTMLQALRCVDQVFIFDDDTPEALICEIQPDILVKGPQPPKTEIPGAKWVLDRGGKVLVPSWMLGISTTRICERIKCGI